MPDERPLRDVLREVEEEYAYWNGAPMRLARELRALAPLLRELAAMAELTITIGKMESGKEYKYETELMNQARAKADELEARDDR